MKKHIIVALALLLVAGNVLASCKGGSCKRKPSKVACKNGSCKRK